ncbi:MAG: zinc metalloprotease [Rhodobacterales bacterium]|nr:MAG: zinc metalloprotease [Rhodobacterales bacterium]
MEKLEAGGVEVWLKRSARAKRLSLRVSRLDGRVTLTLPMRAPEREARRFLADKADWVRAQLAQGVEPVVPMPGGSLLFRGEVLPIMAAPGRSVHLQAGEIRVPERDPARSPARLAAFLKLQAREALSAASIHHATRLGVRYSRLTLRDTRSRWGSCSHRGALMYSWRLILAPPEVLDYVAAHEVAHLVEMNHSPAFWATVARTLPGYEAPRRWLRDHGAELHRYRFREA